MRGKGGSVIERVRLVSQHICHNQKLKMTRISRFEDYMNLGEEIPNILIW